MARPRNWFGCLIAALALLTWSATPGLARRVRGTFTTTMQQCANRINGTSSATNDCTGSAWVKGNLNTNNSVYRQGDFVPFRLEITGFVAGRTYSVRIGYDAVESGLHAYDYLGSYDASIYPGQQIVPCDAVAGTAGPHACGNNPSTLAVPTDTTTTFPSGAGQIPGSFSAWGGTLQGAAYVNPTPIGVDTTGTVERAIDITFTAAGGTVVLAWGGHIASALDWGSSRVYTSVHSGAPFHVRLKQVQESGQPPETVGNQELSMHAAALAPAPGLTTQAAPPSATTDQTVVDTATLAAVSGNGEVRGTVEFFVCFGATARPDCSQGGTSIGLQNVVISVGSNNGTASMGFAADQDVGGQGPGFYCFRVEYTPASNALYTPAVHTDTTAECFVATLPPPLLTVTKLCDPKSDPGLFNLLLDGSPVPNGTDVACGGSRGPFQTTVGSHTVSESAGTGTNLADYTAAFGGDCAPAGSLVLALGDSAVCTITNTRLPPTPPASLTVHKVCDPANDPGNFVILVDDQPVAILACGQSTTPVTLTPGAYTVREASGEGTSLSDYTTDISGDCASDGSITLAPGDAAACTFTNTRIPPPTTTLRVDKVCIPAGDDGRFKVGIFKIDGTPVHGAVLRCGGSTGAVHVSPGRYVIRERGAGSTVLSDYHRFVGGDCAFDGTVVVGAGDQLRCVILNVRKGTEPLPAELTVTKICDPVDDGGRFDLTVDGQTGQDVACGESFGPVALSPGSHQVSESAGTDTSLGDYTTTIGGACAADGSVTLAAGEVATCTITNVRTSGPEPPPDQTGTVEIAKRCSPAGTQGSFQVELDEQVFRVSCGQSTGPVEFPVGDHRVGEVVSLDANTTATFKTTVGGDCAPDGSFTLNPDEHVTCVVTNTLVPPEPPLKPPSACYTLSAAPPTATAGKQIRVVARVHLARTPIAGVRVYLTGPGVSAARRTGRTGRAQFVVKPHRRGVLRVSIRKAFDCPKRPPKKIGIVGAATPPVTG